MQRIPSVRAILAVALATLAAPVAAQEASPSRSGISPFIPLDDGQDGIRRVLHDTAAYGWFAEQHTRGGLLELQGFALPDGQTADLLLRPTRVMADGAYAIEMLDDGQSRRIYPDVKLFAGTTVGFDGSVFLAVTPTRVNGYLELPGGLVIVSSSDDEVVWVSQASKLPAGSAAQSWCDAIAGGLADESVPPAPPHGLGSGPSLTTVDIYVDGDNEFVDEFANATAASNYAVTLFGAMAQVYRRDLGIVVNIPAGYLRMWTTGTPWGVGAGIGQVRDWWMSGQNPDQNVPRAGVHVLTHPVFGGVAYFPGICNTDYDLAYSGVNGSFPNPIQHQSGSNWDLMVVSHETGHNFGSGHTFDGYNPPIDCYDGSGPDDGTIMSYCHLEPGGMAQVGMRFHQRVQAQIIAHTNNSGCTGSLAIAMGDYDHDGDVDNTDLASFDQYRNQGFHSQGVIDVFDFDGDGALGDCDRDQLLDVINGSVSLAFTADFLWFNNQPVTLEATGADPFERVYFVYSTTGEGCGPCPNKIGGLCLDVLQPLQVLGFKDADGAGTATWNFNVPGNAPSGLELALQAVVRRGAGGVDSQKSNTQLAEVF